MFEMVGMPIRLLLDGFGLPAGEPFTEALHFFLTDLILITFMLSLMVFAISFLRSFFPVEKTKKHLEGMSPWVGYPLSAVMGVLSPFCSCSTVPLFIGFVRGGIPLGLTLTFLITSPLVNEAALALMIGLFGWKVALVYTLTGMSMGILAGLVLSRLPREKVLQAVALGPAPSVSLHQKQPSLSQRSKQSLQEALRILKKVFPWLVLGLLLGAGLHGWIPENWISENPLLSGFWGVPVATSLGVPLYSGASGTLPLIQSLISKGMPMGTALAFLMAVSALSLPEAFLLKQVMRPKLLGLFFGVTTLGIMVSGFLLNLLFS